MCALAHTHSYVKYFLSYVVYTSPFHLLHVQHFYYLFLGTGDLQHVMCSKIKMHNRKMSEIYKTVRELHSIV